MKRNNRRKDEKSCNLEASLTRMISLLCLSIILLHFIASFFPEGRMWGVNHWAHFSPWVGLSLTVLALLFLLPAFNHSVLKIIKGLISPLFNLTLKKQLLCYLILSLLFFIPFWILRSKTYFLGDGYLILSNIKSTEAVIKWTESPESFLHIQAFHLAKSLFNLDAVRVCSPPLGAETLYGILNWI